ncbi:MAG TPA: uroporphyrinogen-III synthase [Gemmatimonadales bacterium]|nr:uroporphyrinogen-III synthase [Gemmatimonadales bacterium]
MAALKRLPVAVEQRPLMNFAPPQDWAPLDDALACLNQYGAVAVTSPRAAQAVAERLRARSAAVSAGSLPVAWASGPATAVGLDGLLGSVRLPATRGGRLGAAHALARAMLAEHVAGPVLFPCGEAHREELPAVLRSAGLSVDEIVCYRSVLADVADARVAAQLGTILIVASPMVASLLAQACPRGHRPGLLAVGPTTAESARAAGWPPAAVAVEPSVRGLAAAVKGLLENR